MANEGRMLIYFDELVTMLARAYKTTMRSRIYSPNDFISSMQGIRPVDAVEVVRCKDCKHTDTDGMKDPAIYCQKWDYWEIPEDFYCACGERRNDDRIETVPVLR